MLRRGDDHPWDYRQAGFEGKAYGSLENNVTAIEREPVVMELTEDAYKQNSVYRPWHHANLSAPVTTSGIYLTRHQGSKLLASVGRELAAVMPV